MKRASIEPGGPPAKTVKGRIAKCNSSNHLDNDSTVLVYLNKGAHQDLLAELVRLDYSYLRLDWFVNKFYFFSSGALDPDTVRRSSLTRNVIVCEVCIQNAHKSNPDFKLLSEVYSKLDNLQDCDSDLLELLFKVFVKISVILHKGFAEDAVLESKSVKTHKKIKIESDNIDFLCNDNRCFPVINTLLGLSGHKLLSDKNELRKLPEKKIFNLSLAYESLMGLTNSNVITAPSLMRNLKLLKSTHSRNLISVCGFPTGGAYKLLQKLATGSLPELDPPKIGDFVSADDNLQVNIYKFC